MLATDSEISRSVDIFACGSTLGNLLRFIQGDDKQFRMLIERVEGTVFFIRRENTARELIPDVKGYGHSFPETYTTWEAGVKGSKSHQRVLSYRFGGLGILLRFEGDGYLLDDEGEKDGDDKPSTHSESSVTQTIDDLAAELDRNRLTGTHPAEGGNLKVTYSGDLVSQERIFELKTRSVRRKEGDSFENTFSDQLHRLWIAQIPKFILAYHRQGVFEEISIRDATSDIKAWERDHVDTLSRLAALLHQITDLVWSKPNGKLELRHMTAGTLEVREQLEDAGDALSAPIRAVWAKASGFNDGVTTGGLASDSDGADGADGANGADDVDENASSLGWDEGSEPDYTACSEDCEYCGRCSYR